MNHLFRELAPVSDAAWSEIESEAKRALENFLAARRLVDFTGPHGWDAAAVPLGTLDKLARGPVEGVEGARRQIQPYIELRARFALLRQELDAIDRGHKSPDLTPVVDAALGKALGQSLDGCFYRSWIGRQHLNLMLSKQIEFERVYIAQANHNHIARFDRLRQT